MHLKPVIQNLYYGAAIALRQGLALAFLLTVFSVAAVAQVPGELVPGRQQTEPPPEPQSLPGPIAPRIGGQQAPEASNEITFLLTQIDILGAITLTPGELKDIWEPYLWQTISVSDLYTIANAITQRYADMGYALSFAFLPEQEIDSSGIVYLRVVEGYIEQAVFSGDLGTPEDPLPDNLRTMTQNIVKSRPLRTEDLERYLLLMNDIPGMKVETTFSASRTTPDASNLIVKFKRERFSAEAKVDNNLSASLGYWNMSATARGYGLLTSADILEVVKTCGLYCDVYNNNSVSYSTYIGTEGLKIGFRYDSTKITPQTGLLTTVDFNGDNQNIVFDYSYPLIRSRQQNLSIGGSFALTDNETTTFFGTLTRDSLRVVEGFARYDYADETGAITLMQGTITQGLPIMGHTKDNDPLRSKALGSATFTNVSFTATRDQPLAGLLPKLSEYSLYLSARGQYAAASPLLSASQCFYGGSDFGRGYDSGAIGGDHCLMAAAEIRRGFQIKKMYLQAYGFIDAGAVWLKDLPAGAEDFFGAQSYGLGARMFLTQNAQGSLQVSWPARESLASNGKDTPRAIMTLRWIY